MKSRFGLFLVLVGVIVAILGYDAIAKALISMGVVSLAWATWASVKEGE